MTFRLIEAEKAQHPVSLLCSVLGVTRAGYYGWRQRGPSRRALGDAELASLIGRVLAESFETYSESVLECSSGVWWTTRRTRSHASSNTWGVSAATGSGTSAAVSLTALPDQRRRAHTRRPCVHLHGANTTLDDLQS